MTTKHYLRLALCTSSLLVALWAINTASASGATPQTGQGATHEHDDHHAGVNKRGDQVMGFAHDKTIHHFRLRTDGGLIEVETKDPNDTKSQDQIRTHLQHIARKFAAGDFFAPMLIHAKTPPGVPTMKQLKAAIKYEYEETARGGQVRLVTSNSCYAAGDCEINLTDGQDRV